MTQPGTDGKYDLGKGFYYKKRKNDEGQWELTNEPDTDIVRKHFLTPKPVLWQDPPHLQRTVISVGIGSAHLVVVARDHGQWHGHVYTSGDNTDGQLGLGDDGRGTNRHALTLVRSGMRPVISPFPFSGATLSLSYTCSSFSCILATDDRFKRSNVKTSARSPRARNSRWP
jgi:hypothetical protein